MHVDSFARDALPKLGDITSAALETAVAQMVASKHVCDALARCHDPLAAMAGEGLDFWSDWYHTPDGFSFFARVFPFVRWDGTDIGISALVPARRTIGDAHRQYPETMTPEQQQTKLAYLQHPDRGVWGNEECATYTWIKPLGLFLAGEGKNRVSLFQRAGAEWIPACVSTQDYPAPERMVLYLVRVAGFAQCWAVLDGRWAQHVASPAWALPVLQAYGVLVRSRWPTEFPELAAVRRAHAKIADDRRGPKPQVDLDVVRARDEWGNTRVWISPWSGLPLKSLWKWIAAWSTATLIGALLMMVPAGWTWSRGLGAALLGAAAGTFVLVQIKSVPMRQRDVGLAFDYHAWAKGAARARCARATELEGDGGN